MKMLDESVFFQIMDGKNIHLDEKNKLKIEKNGMC